MIVGDYIIEYRNVSFGADHDWYPLEENVYFLEGSHDIRKTPIPCGVAAPVTVGLDELPRECTKPRAECKKDRKHGAMIGGKTINWPA